mgnify:CR=1 FL=1
MKNRHKFLTALLTCFALSLGVAVNAQQQSIVGDWQGKLSVSGVELRIVFHILKSESGDLSAKMDSPDQGANGIPTTSTTFQHDSLVIRVERIGGVYTGKLLEDKNSIKGTWAQGGASFPLDLKRTDEKIVIERPQEPKPPFPYRVEEITFENNEAGVTLAGTFTSPESDGPFPTVVLISGSGPQNRDEELLTHKPFLVIADFFTRQGIAVLRYDDRGVAKSTGNFAEASSEDFAQDVTAAVEYLKTRSEVDQNNIGLVGHSEGGLIAPMVAVESSDVGFIVLMAGPGLPGSEILLLQSALIAKAGGASDELIDATSAYSKKVYEVINRETDNEAAKKEIRTHFDEYWANAPEDLKTEAQKFGDPEKNFDASIGRLLSDWFRFFLKYDPRSTLKKVKCPVLAINGEKDLQVPPKENLAAIEKALINGGNKNITVKEFPQLNHLFQTSTTGAPSEYAQIEETFSPEALEFMADWIRGVVSK